MRKCEVPWKTEQMEQNGEAGVRWWCWVGFMWVTVLKKMVGKNVIIKGSLMEKVSSK